MTLGAVGAAFVLVLAFLLCALIVIAALGKPKYHERPKE